MKTRVCLTTVDDDGKIEVIIYDETGEKEYSAKVEELYFEDFTVGMNK